MTVRRGILLSILFVLLIVYTATFLSRYRYQNETVPPAPPVADDTPSSAPRKSFHDNKNPEAWVQYIKDGLVRVQIVDSKTVIIFRPQEEYIKLFERKKGSITPVTFECGKNPEEKCDLAQPYKLYVNNAEVELVEIISKTTPWGVFLLFGYKLFFVIDWLKYAQ